MTDSVPLDEGMRMPVVTRFLLLMVLALGGCGLFTPPTPAQQSHYGLGHFFQDPQAQALALAAEKGDTTEVRRLMKEEGVNPDVFFGLDGMPLVAWPVYTHNPEGLRAMLESGADPNVKLPYKTLDRGIRNNNNAMVWAAAQEDPIYLELLLDHGGDPDTRSANNESLLFHAIINGSKHQNVRLLVERGADPNAEAGMGATILEHYGTVGGFEMIYWLIQRGADPSITYFRSEPVHAPDSRTIQAIYWYPENTLIKEWQRKCRQWLIQQGYERPPMSDYHRNLRKDFNYPYEEKDIPLL